MQESTGDNRSDPTTSEAAAATSSSSTTSSSSSPEGGVLAFLLTPTFDDRIKFSQEICRILEKEPLESILSQIHDLIAALLVVSEDPEQIVRACFVDKFANIFQQCQKHASPDLDYYLNDLLLDIVVKYLYEGSKEVRGQAFVNLIKIIGLLETNTKKIEEKIFPAIIQLSKNTDYGENSELNLMAIRLMARTACILGPEKTEKLILDRFLEYCKFRMDPFRRTCACVFPSICYAMGVEYTEKKLLNHFFELCNDSFWGVRRACAESITSLSLLCSAECRTERISPVVMNLVKDESKWVVCTILKKLGPFISTFADPCITGLVFSDLGELHIINPTDEDFGTQANPELLANYQYYLEKFSETGVQQTTKNCQRRCYKDALSSEKIAERIIETKAKLFEQVNYDSYVIKRMLSRRDLDSSIDINKSSSIDINESNIDINKSSSIDINEDSIDINEDSIDINKSSIAGKEKYNELHPESDDETFLRVIDSFTKNFEEKYGKFGDSSNNSIDDIKETINHPDNNININSEDIKKHSGELHTKNRRITGPSDLSNIIKQVIDATDNHPPPQLMRQTSTDDLMMNSSLNNTTVDNKEIAGDVFHQSSNNNANGADSDPSKEWDLFSEIDIDDNMLVYDGSLGKQKDVAQKNVRRSNIYQRFSDLQNVMYVSNSNRRKKEFEDKYYSVSETVTTNDDKQLNESSNEDEAFMEFNSHKYWYISPDLPLDPDLVETENRVDWAAYQVFLSKAMTHTLPTDYEQDVVPPAILRAFVNMVTEDEGINLSCAHDFPAVALTIGRKNWHLLKSLLQYLCDDIDWKVRKTIASYIDLLAMILGREIASNDLLPIYVGFFKDLDEVKIKAIKNAANFLKVIDHQKHEDVLSRIGDCLRVDSKTNWRIKEDLAKQVLLLIRMYNFVDKQDSFLYITSLTALFLEDKISCVRELAADAMVEIIRIANAAEQDGIVKLFLVKEFALSDSWRKRQTFLNTLLKLIKCDHPPTNIFRLVFSSVRNLSYDRVPNVRLLVAKCLNELTKLDERIFQLKACENIAIIVELIRKLKNDTDRDVRDILSGIEESNLLEWSGYESESKQQTTKISASSTEEKEPQTSSTEEIEIKLRDAIVSESQT